MKLADLIIDAKNTYDTLQNEMVFYDPGWEVESNFFERVDVNSDYDVDVSPGLVSILDKLNSDTPLTENEIDSVLLELRSIEDYGIKSALENIIMLKCIEVIYRNEAVIIQANEALEKGEVVLPSSNKFVDLYNVYALMSKYSPHSLIGIDTAFALNTLGLAGHLPSHQPIIPTFIAKDWQIDPSMAERAPGRKVVDTSQFVPYQRGKKGTRDPVQTSFKAYNKQNKKIMFVRAQKLLPKRNTEYNKQAGESSPHTIFASKIAQLIDNQSFSSERMLDTTMAASRAIAHHPITNANMLSRRNETLGGAGMIDEVLNFTGEEDKKNLANFGTSTPLLHRTPDVSQLRATKIDFDFSNLASPIAKRDYEQDVMTSMIYSEYNYRTLEPQYLFEKMTTRLKLSLFSPQLAASLAEKSYSPTAQEAKQQALHEVQSRTNIAFTLLLENFDYFFKKNPGYFVTLLVDATQSNLDYIDKHKTFNVDKTVLVESIQQMAIARYNDYLKQYGSAMMPCHTYDELMAVHQQMQVPQQQLRASFDELALTQRQITIENKQTRIGQINQDVSKLSERLEELKRIYSQLLKESPFSDSLKGNLEKFKTLQWQSDMLKKLSMPPSRGIEKAEQQLNKLTSDINDLRNQLQAREEQKRVREEVRVPKPESPKPPAPAFAPYGQQTPHFFRQPPRSTPPSDPQLNELVKDLQKAIKSLNEKIGTKGKVEMRQDKKKAIEALLDWVKNLDGNNSKTLLQDFKNLRTRISRDYPKAFDGIFTHKTKDLFERVAKIINERNQERPSLKR